MVKLNKSDIGTIVSMIHDGNLVENMKVFNVGGSFYLFTNKEFKNCASTSSENSIHYDYRRYYVSLSTSITEIIRLNRSYELW